MMERRKLLQSLAALPAMVVAGKNGESVGVKYEVKPDKKYMIFLNPALIDVDTFCETPTPLPAGTPVYITMLHGDDTMDDAIRIYEIEKD
jgi:hypothetical protein